jgi:hypothetical protein
VVLAGGKTGIG